MLCTTVWSKKKYTYNDNDVMAYCSRPCVMYALLSYALSFVFFFTYFNKLLFSLSIIVITLIKSLYIGY